MQANSGIMLQLSDEEFVRRWDATDHHQASPPDYQRSFICPKCGKAGKELLECAAGTWQVKYGCEKCTPEQQRKIGSSKRVWRDSRDAYASPETVTDPVLGIQFIVWRRHLRLRGSHFATLGTLYKTLFQALYTTTDDDNRLGMFQLTHRTDFDEMFGSVLLRPFQWYGKESIARGNRKLVSSVGLFSLPPGAPPAGTCPGAGECESYCYAKKEYTQYKNVGAAWRRNYHESRKSTFVNDVVGWLRIHANTVKAFRMHESGDFYSQPYLNKWAEIAEQSPHVHFYTYTKSLGLNLQPLTRLPNFTVIKSEGGKLDRDPRVGIKYEKEPYARVVDSKNKVKSGEYLCPAVATGKKQKDKICGSHCRYCWGRGIDGKQYQVRVCFLKHNSSSRVKPKAKRRFDLTRSQALELH